jgi:hypothetical protein
MGSTDFYSADVHPEEVEFQGEHLWAPLWYHDSTGFSSMHTASYEAVAAELPSEAIRPLRWTGDRTLVQVSALQCRSVTWAGPDGTSDQWLDYAVVTVGAQVTEGPAPRVLPLLQGRTGIFVLQMPETTRQAVVGGRGFYGLPKFLADMDFRDEGASRSVAVSEHGRHLLTLTVRPRGRPRQVRMLSRFYSAHRGELLRTISPTWSFGQLRWGSGGAAVALGEHPVADRLRRLDVSPRPISAVNLLRHRAMMPMPEPIGPARDYPVYLGSDADATSRYTITYPYGPTIDQYASAALPG